MTTIDQLKKNSLREWPPPICKNCGDELECDDPKEALIKLTAALDDRWRKGE